PGTVRCPFGGPRPACSAWLSAGAADCGPGVRARRMHNLHHPHLTFHPATGLARKRQVPAGG
ncbi:MAG: hypothetical protein M3537_06530, partial [Chloroflexota bacterium]|nr:hypothetical protein [Chloroflexota bacterium]